MAAAVCSQRRAFRCLGSPGAVVAPSRLMLPGPEEGDVTLYKPALLLDDDGQGSSCLACKVVAVRPNNAALGLPTIPATILLHDPGTGMPLAFMDGTYLTGVRTAAGSAVATELLSDPSSTHLVVFGAGTQARWHVSAMKCVRPSLTSVTIVNRTLGTAQALVQQLQSDLGSAAAGIATWEAVAWSDTAAVTASLATAHIVCTCTGAQSPLFTADALRPGAHVNAVGSFNASGQELPPSLFGSALVAIDYAAGVRLCGDVQQAVAQGIVSADHEWLHLGDIVAATHSSGHHAATWHKRADHDQVTLFKSVGVAAQDASVAQLAYETALQKGIGQRITL